jgi:hypothetical protein
MTVLNSDARRLNVKGLLIAVGLPVVLVGALVATLLGTGAFSRTSHGEDASLWLWTTPTGEIARVNGMTAATDARFEVTDAAGNKVQIEQTDRHLLLRNIATGQVSAVDLTTLAITGTADTAPGEGVRIALHEDGAFIVDRLQGKVNQVDPVDLSPVGEPLSFPAGLTGGVFDREGSLWLGVPREGTLVEIQPGETGATTVDTREVAAPRQQLSLTVLGDGVAVLNSTAQKMTTLRGDGSLHETDVELLGPTQTAESSPGTVAAVTITDPPSVVTVNNAAAKRFDIDAVASELLGASMEFHERIYVPDGVTGTVWVYDLDGNELDQIQIDSGRGPIELYHAGDVLFANAVNTSQAVVVAADGTARLAEKDRDDILGGNFPPDDAPESDESSGDGDENQDQQGDQGGQTEGPPGTVANLSAVAGDRQITLSWDAAPNNGAALTKYVIEGNGETWDIAPGQRVLEIGGLVNGDSYTFTVTAHNAHGAGPSATSPAVSPSADIPDAVQSVAATANPDGTVSVSWDEPDAQGLRITGYQVEAVNAEGDRDVVGTSSGTSFTVPDGELAYGAQYGFMVTTVAGNAAAEPSPLSDTVVPFNVPNAPTDLLAETAADATDAIDVSWGQPRANGRVIEEYRVTAEGRTETVRGATSIRLNGLPGDSEIEIQVVAVNEAGESEAATTVSNTMQVPQAQYSNYSSTASTMSINYAFDRGGANQATCVLYNIAQDKVQASEACDGTFDIGPHYATTEYDFYIEITNAAGTSKSANFSVRTKDIYGEVYFGCSEMNTVYCNSSGRNGVGIYDNAQRNGTPTSYTKTGNRHRIHCWTTGPEITPRGQETDGYNDYHPGKDTSNVQLLINGHKGYIPFVWINIEGVGKNSLSDVPRC